MKELPVAMSAPMVRASLRERSPKIVTRRIVRDQPPENCGAVTCGEYHPTIVDRRGAKAAGAARFGAYSQEGGWTNPSPYGAPGTLLWLREAWRTEKTMDNLSGKEIGTKAVDAGYRFPWAPLQYEADMYRRDWVTGFSDGKTEPGRLRLARFMPRWASRVSLLVTAVRIERLHDITDDEAWDEGIEESEALSMGCTAGAAVAAYSALWERLHGAGSWDLNPFVWVINFKKVEPQDPSRKSSA